MRDDLQQLPPLLITLLTGGQLRRGASGRHKTVPVEFVRQKKAQQQQQMRSGSRLGGRPNSNQVGPFSEQNMDQTDGGLRQRRPPANDVEVNTEPRKRLVRPVTQAEENQQTQIGPQAAAAEDTQQQTKGKKRRLGPEELRQHMLQKDKQKQQNPMQQSLQVQQQQQPPPHYRSHTELSRSRSRIDVAEATTTAERVEGRPARTDSESPLVEVVVSDRENFRVTEVRIPPSPRRGDDTTNHS